MPLLLLAIVADIPRLTEVGRVAPNEIVLTVEEGTIAMGTLKPSPERPGDELRTVGDHVELVRGGEAIGVVVGPDDRRHLRTFDTFEGPRINPDAIDRAASYRLRPEGSGETIAMTAVARKTTITDAAIRPNNWYEMTRRHRITLTAERDLPDGHYTLEVAGNRFSLDGEADAPLAFALSDSTPCPALHVTAAGFRPDDPKIARLSWWSGVGRGRDYAETVDTFAVVDAGTGREVFRGPVGQTVPADAADDYQGLRGRPSGDALNRSGVPVTPLDFSGLREPGMYRLQIDGLGVSPPFAIGRNVYEEVWKLALRGLHMHRRDVDLTLELTDGTTMPRPAADDRVVVTKAPFDGMAGGRFARYEREATDEAVPEARGGWMDAGDFDTNHVHSRTAAVLADLVARHPQALGDDDVGTSDSGNGRPDLLDEALWHVDTYRRLQRDDGGVPSAIEYREHPNRMEPSWLNTLPVYLTAPSTLGNRHFAVAAVRVGRALETLGEDGSAYVAAARRAFEWAEANDFGPKDRDGVRVWASAELMLAGVDSAAGPWRDFVEEHRENPWTIATDAQSHAIATVLTFGEPGAADRLALARMLTHTMMKAYVEGAAERSAFGAVKHGWAPFGYGSGSVPPLEASLLLRPVDPQPPESGDANARMRAAGVAGLAMSLGGNPTGLAYMTGLPTLPTVDDSREAVANVLHLDTRFAGRAAPVGIVVYGALPPVRDGNSWPIGTYIKNQQDVHPAYEQWPDYENVHQFWSWPAMMEYTVHQGIASVIALAAEQDAAE